ncbi:hypothetical protein M0804_004883 [Polistes exclamans]|nr:hypothetical protein M0804_004883 [Polistes exclamans]
MPTPPGCRTALLQPTERYCACRCNGGESKSISNAAKRDPLAGCQEGGWNVVLLVVVGSDGGGGSSSNGGGDATTSDLN